jgi:hypothetical protein
MSAWITSVGGFVAAVLLVVGCLNVVLSAVQQVLAKLSVQEPGWLTTVSTALLKVAQWLGSNPPTPSSTPAATATTTTTTKS